MARACKRIAISVGKGALGGVLGACVLTQGQLRIAKNIQEFAININISNRRQWVPPARRYIGECLAGREGPRGKGFMQDISFTSSQTAYSSMWRKMKLNASPVTTTTQIPRLNFGGAKI